MFSYLKLIRKELTGSLRAAEGLTGMCLGDCEGGWVSCCELTDCSSHHRVVGQDWDLECLLGKMQVAKAHLWWGFTFLFLLLLLFFFSFFFCLCHSSVVYNSFSLSL